MSIKAFNTGRGYSVKGQRIAYAKLSTGNVSMVDIDRGLDYVLVHRPDVPVTDGTVLALYDANKTAAWDAAENREHRALLEALEDAARVV